MPKTAKNEASWVVVEVHSGIPVAVKTFSTYELAEEYSESLRMKLNLENDETGVFQINFAEMITQ
jgi:hypothetical protein